MRRTWLTVPAAGVMAGFLLFHAGANPARLHAKQQTGSASPDVGAASDTTERELSSVVRVGAGLSTITGSVMSGSSSNPVGSVMITVKRLAHPDADGLRTETDDHGRFRFEGIPSGEYVLATHHIGYQDRLDTIDVAHRALLNMDVPLTTEAVELPPIRVEIRSAWLAQTGFYWRKERGLGEFVTPEEIERRSAHNFSQLMHGVQGVEVARVCDRGGYPCERMLRMRQTNDARACRVKYFMDGQPMTGRVYPDDISAHDIAAVEVYRNISETPAQFYGRCGSVVLWSKRFDPTSRNR